MHQRGGGGWEIFEVEFGFASSRVSLSPKSEVPETALSSLLLPASLSWVLLPFPAPPPPLGGFFFFFVLYEVPTHCGMYLRKYTSDLVVTACEHPMVRM